MVISHIGINRFKVEVEVEEILKFWDVLVVLKIDGNSARDSGTPPRRRFDGSYKSSTSSLRAINIVVIGPIDRLESRSCFICNTCISLFL